MGKLKVSLDKSACNGCFVCVDICPMEVFVREEGKATIAKEKDCIGCKACEIQCPKGCIKITEE